MNRVVHFEFDVENPDRAIKFYKEVFNWKISSWGGPVKKKIEASGGKAITPKMPIPGVGYMAYCKDTEGNVFGIMQNDPNAK